MNDDFEADFDGFIPQVRDWVDARCDKRGDIKNNGMQLPKAKTTAEQVNSERSVGTTPMGRHREELSCQKQAQVDLALGAYEEVIKKRNGQTAPLTPDSISPAHAK